MRTSVLIAFLVAMTMVVSLKINETYTFEEYVVQFNKNYSEPEFSRRKEIFNKAVLRLFQTRDQENATYEVGVNKFTDWTEEEKK